MQNHGNRTIKQFTGFRIGMEKQQLHGGRPSSSFLVTYESGKLIAVETWLNKIGQSMRQDRWVWEITGVGLIQTFTVIGKLNAEVVHFKRV
jgi:hypothetical protein